MRRSTREAKPAAAQDPITTPAVAGLGFHLREAYRAFARAFDARLAAHGVTHAQWVMLWFLSQSGSLTPIELARKAGIQKASATTVLEALKRRKLIRGVQDDTDRRKINLTLTKAGATHMQTLIACAAATNMIPRSRFSDTQITELIAMLCRVTESFGQE